jgi:hypothetical protein
LLLLYKITRVVVIIIVIIRWCLVADADADADADTTSTTTGFKSDVGASTHAKVSVPSSVSFGSWFGVIGLMAVYQHLQSQVIAIVVCPRVQNADAVYN